MACFARASVEPAHEPPPADRLNAPAPAANDNTVLVNRRRTITAVNDLLGRITRRAEVGLNSTWTYDTAANGIGWLAVAATSTGYSRTLTYDTLGRPSTTALSYGGNAATYTTTYNFQSGKVASVAYPSGMNIHYGYNAYGYLYQMQNGAGLVVWSVNARDQYLHAVTETAGSGVVTTHVYNARTGRVSGIKAGTGNAVANFTYVFDMVGNLLKRQDHDLSTTDQFTYDPVNRLSTYSLAGGAYQTIGYDGLGDIRTKPGVGNYHYPAAGQPRPHAVSVIVGTVRGVRNPKFTYDGDGNQLSGPGVAAGYTSYDMPAWVSVEQGGTTWGAFNWGSGTWAFTGETFAYDSEHQRVEMTAPTGSTFYFNDPASGGTSEYYVPATGAAQWRDYFVADGRMVAERIATVGGSAAMQYFVADHLGSIAVATDASGNVVQRMVYDPWGVQLAPDGSQLCGAGPTTRGYTGEEQMPLGCLVNLNARVYDPILGRFMSGDPVTGNIYDMQSLNRYGYVLNNPLSMTDSNGECPFCLFFVYAALSILGGIEEYHLLHPLLQHTPLLGNLYVIALGVFCGPGAPLCAVEAAGEVAGVESGSVGAGLKAFVLSYAESSAFNFVGGRLQASHLSKVDFTAAAVLSHGLIGGTLSVAQGGGFGSGFIAAGIDELAAPYIEESTGGNPGLGAIESAIVGGTVSILGGGKFGNGAVTGAFSYLYNQIQHRINQLQVGHDADQTLLNYATFVDSDRYFGQISSDPAGTTRFWGFPDLGYVPNQILWEVKSFGDISGYGKVEFYSLASLANGNQYLPADSHSAFFVQNSVTLIGDFSTYTYSFEGSGLLWYTRGKFNSGYTYAPIPLPPPIPAPTIPFRFPLPDFIPAIP